MERIDIHDYARKVNWLTQKIQNSQELLPLNKKILDDYYNVMVSEGA